MGDTFPLLAVAPSALGIYAKFVSIKLDFCGLVAEALAAPPSCNTGVQTPNQAEQNNKSQVTALNDWVSCTFATMDTPQPIMDMLGGDWVPMPHGHHGYRKGFVCGGCMIFFDGQECMGVHLQISGEGCRELEARGIVQPGETAETGWRAFLRQLSNLGAKFKRADFAFDDRCNLISLDEVLRCIDRGEVVSRWKKADPRKPRKLAPSKAGDLEEGQTIYFGSGKSAMLCRMYDKANQQRAKGVQVEGDWTRVELQARDERAHTLVLCFVAYGIETVAGVLRSLLEFKVPNPNDPDHRYRWETVDWWETFLNHCEKAYLAVDAVVKTLAEIEVYLEKQFGPSIAMLLQGVGGDLEAFSAMFLRMARSGKNRWRSKHKAILSAYSELVAAG